MSDKVCVPVQALEWELKVLGLENTIQNRMRIRRAREVKVRPIGAVRFNVPVNPLKPGQAAIKITIKGDTTY